MKTIPSQLLLHKREVATTLCYLVRMEAKDGTIYGATDLDVDITYDDGQGVVVYEASRGFVPSALSMEGSLSIDNTDLSGLLAYLDLGITPQQIRAGKMDFASVWIYQVNYKDLTMGHEIMARGSFGEATVQDATAKVEFRGMAQPLKQSLCQFYSFTCRAQYGDIRCGKAFEWFEGTISALGDDPTAQVVAGNLAQPDDYFNPGVIEFTSGVNVGAKAEVVGYGEGGVIDLLIPVYYPFAVGDTFRIRIDCPKTGDAAGCRDTRRWGPVDWRLHFRGETLMPVGDDPSVPGANTT
jgi:uncharacterized phage protein (TIGR02218 family)